MASAIPVLYQLSYQAIWELVSMLVRNIPIDDEEYTHMNVWNIIYLNCGERYEDMIDHRSCAHSLSSCEIKAQIYDISYIHMYSSSSMGILRTRILNSSQMTW